MHRRQNEPEQLKPGFVLVSPMVKDAESFAPKLTAACRAGNVAAVILRLSSAGDADLLTRARVLVPAVQATGAAFLLDGLPQLVVPAAADGVHLGDSKAIQSVKSELKDKHIVGAGGLANRHDAMVAGENGADYVLFGEPDAAGRRPLLPALVERVTWWAELFKPPAIAYAGNLDEIETLVRAGADFIALGEEVIWNSPAGPAAALAAASVRLDASEPVK
jgi:thiamine-phosphate pyrophosphorylase